MNHRLAYWLLTCFVLSSANCLAAEQSATVSTFTVTSQAGAAWTVTRKGLSQIKLGTREVAKGAWRIFNADWTVRKADPQDTIGDVLEKSLTRVNDAEVRVRHVHKNIVVTYDYRFDGEDVTVKARVENNDPRQTLHAVEFRGLQFAWQAPPSGVLTVTHGTWILAHPGAMYHPSETVKIGGTYG
jgi:hypothetical protein